MSIDLVIASNNKYNDTIFQKGYCKLFGFPYNLRLFENNTRGLAELYNKCIVESNSDYIIFCHDDVSIEDSQLPEKIDQAIGDDSEFAICGVAGNQKCRVQDKNLWHLMGDRESMSGAVAHYTGKDDTECFMTNFGVTPKRCILLDGVFLAVNVKKIREVGLKFDEDCPAKFNHYDLNFCMRANELDLKMTTWPIWIVHKSHGLSDINQEDWNKGNEYFKKKWINKL